MKTDCCFTIFLLFLSFRPARSTNYRSHHSNSEGATSPGNESDNTYAEASLLQQTTTTSRGAADQHQIQQQRPIRYGQYTIIHHFSISQGHIITVICFQESNLKNSQFQRHSINWELNSEIKLFERKNQIKLKKVCSLCWDVLFVSKNQYDFSGFLNHKKSATCWLTFLIEKRFGMPSFIFEPRIMCYLLSKRDS